MPNEIQIECFFKSAEIAKLCADGEHIVVHFKASFPPDAPPAFKISADSFSDGVKAGKSVRASAEAGPGLAGCPTPCR